MLTYGQPMPFDRPSLITLIERAQADMDSRLAGSPFLRRRLMPIVARMEGGVAHGLYGYMDWLALQLMPDTAETEHLNRWSTIWGVHRKPAVHAEGEARFRGDNGSLFPAGTTVQRQDGVLYVSAVDVFVAEGVARVPLRAQDAGTAGNAAPGVPVRITFPIAGVEAQGVSIAGLSGGTDEERDAGLRARLLARIRTQPSGGAARDYVAWALQAPGVTRAWCYPGEMGRGSVAVRFVMDTIYENGIPMPDDVDRVKAHIESLRPITADVYVAAPIPRPVNLDLRVVPDTPRVRAAAEAAWAALRREAEPGGVVVRSRLTEAVSLAEGEEDHTLLSPAGNLQMPTGHLAVPGAIAWED